MIEKTTQSVANLGYHAHIYYDPRRTRAVAERVCAEIGEVMTVVQTAMLAGLPYQRLRNAVIAHLTMAEGLGPFLANVAPRYPNFADSSTLGPLIPAFGDAQMW
jgi:hypothetical protein